MAVKLNLSRTTPGKPHKHSIEGVRRRRKRLLAKEAAGKIAAKHKKVGKKVAKRATKIPAKKRSKRRKASGA